MNRAIFFFILTFLSSNLSFGSSINRTGVDVHAKMGLSYGGGFGMDYFSSDSWALGFDLNGFRGSNSDYSYSLSQFALSGRWHPYQTAFFYGALLGSQVASVVASDTINGFKAEATLEIKNAFLTPMVGWMWTEDFGLSWGFELGLQLQGGATSTVTSNTENTAITTHPDYIAAEKDAKEAGDKFGRTTLLHITFLRIGYVF